MLPPATADQPRPAALPPRRAKRIPAGKTAGAFTLLELLVSMVILTIILGILLNVVGAFSGGFSTERQRLASFRETRGGFEAINRLLAQAMLNTFFDYDPPLHLVANNATVSRYARASNLHFVTGPATSPSLLGPGASVAGGGTPAGHAAFFVAPVGYDTEVGVRLALPSTLSVCGFLLTRGGTPLQVPSKADTSESPPYSLLYQVVQPTSGMGLYRNVGDTAADPDWFRDAVADGSNLSLLARNVLVLAFLPLASLDPGEEAIAGTDGVYDTKRYLASPGTLADRMRNQLPSFIRTLMVVLDDQSANRLLGLRGAAVSLDDLGLDGRFANLPDSSSAAQLAAFENDLKEIREGLDAKGLRYRVFQTDVRINQAKWNRD